MAVDTDFKSLLNTLKVEDPWLPPRPWESIPTESGLSHTTTSRSTSTRLYDTSTVTEASLVRLAMNALQGLESSLISIEKLCAIFRSDPADRTFHRIPSMWTKSVSTLALEKILRSFGRTGCGVFFLYKFVNHFANLSPDDAALRSNKSDGSAVRDYAPYSLVNQAFAVAVNDVLEGYIAALDTLYSSVCLRRLSNVGNVSSGCLSSVGHSEVTLLEVYLHTKELRNQIEVIGSICNVYELANCFSVSPLEDLVTQTKFTDFPRGGNLLTSLYKELQVADPVHSALLRTLFIRSCEPYFDFIRSWIFKAKISDPFNEFVVAEVESNTVTIREEDGVFVPCFLREFLTPLFRAGQQLQVLIKLLEFSDGVGSWNRTYEDFLPYWSRMSSSHLSHAFHMDFSKEGIEMMVVERRDYYKVMMEKLKKNLPNLEFKYHQVISYATLPTSGRGSLEVPSTANGRPVSPSAKNMNQNLAHDTVECDASSMTDEYSYLEDSSDSSSVENYGEEEKTGAFFNDSDVLEKKYLSALEFNSETSFDTLLKTPSPDESPSTSTMGTESHELSNNADLPGYDMSLRSLKSCQVECANQILGKNKLRQRCSKVKLPFFDFESVQNPLTECVDRLGSTYRANSADNMRNYHNKGHVGDAITAKKNSFHTHASFDLKNNHQEQELLPSVSGGGGWESLLDGAGNKNDIHPAEHKTTVATVIDIPLDYVLEKCLLEEIQLQYMYVSKLTIKLLEEGFSLEQHLLALRRYHMMESADWADLFIVSLRQHKWYATEADKRISEIQSLLELSVQRSSCEKDRYKDRLFMYMKEYDSSLPSFSPGIQSFNGLGLGYRVDWPVSIVLTPGALKIYAQIFSFLIQVKLASSSLTEVWCSFKEFIHFSNQDRSSSVHKSKSRNFNIMVKLRHQIFHFVSTLQQYVQSQLSHVSWCRFLESLKHKVKDLTDLDFVHMDYLNDSRCICFLSDDMKQIAEIIQSILQCALDFRSVAGLNGDLMDVSQVLNIKRTFDQNIRQLYACYLNSPKNVEFSLPRFWEYLDYNHHYSDVINDEMGHRIFSI